MEEESKGLANNNISPQQHLRELLLATFRGRTPADTRQAQALLAQGFQSPGFTDQVASLVIGQEDLDIKKAAASLLKNHAYDLAQGSDEKAPFIQLLYGLIMQGGVDAKVKELLGGALEHLFNRDEEAVYKNVVKEKMLQALREEGFEHFHACLAIIQAHFNSLLAEPDQVAAYFCEILQPVAAKALQLYNAITSMPFEEWLLQDRLIMPTLTFLFEFLESAFEKMAEEEDYYHEDLQIVQRNEFMIGLLESYLLLFHNNHSIVTHAYPAANPLKATITTVAAALYSREYCPEKVFQIMFLTVLSECRGVVEEPQVERILVQCLNVLESHLQRQSFAGLFQQHKLEFVFALFMYSSTNQEERDAIEDDPQLFAEMAEDYTEGAANSTFLKVRAACMLKVFADRIDQGPRNILEIIMVILSGSIGEQDQDSQLMQCVKAEFSRFDFYGLSRQQKLQTSFMVLATLAPQINLRPDMNKVVYAFFLTQFQALLRLDNPLVILRIIRSISYYPSALYFLYIETQMARGKAFVLEGIKALERILRTNKFSELFQFLSTIFIKLLAVVRVQDPVMQLIVINYHEQMLKANAELYRTCRAKIKESFFASAATNQHAALVSFNLLYALLRKEKDPAIISILERDFYDIAASLEAEEQQSLYWKYEQKLIETYQLIVQRSPAISAEVQRFAVRSLRFLARQEKGTQMFRFYNVYLVKLDGAIFKLDTYFRAFWEEAQRRYRSFIQPAEHKESLEPLAYYCFLMSEIMANHCEIPLTEGDLRLLLEMAERVAPEEKQYPLMVLLTYLYVQPYPTTNFLKRNNIYEQFLAGVTQVTFSGAIPRKIFNLAYIMLLEIEENPVYIRQILLQCIHNLRQLNRRSRNRLLAAKTVEIRTRRLGEERAGERAEEAMEAEDDNELVNLFVKFKHPFEMLSEFDQFKVKFWMNDHLMSDLEEGLRADLRSIMETEVVERTKLRIIRKVKRQ